MFKRHRERQEAALLHQYLQTTLRTQQRTAAIRRCTDLVVAGSEVRFPAQLWESRAVRHSQWASYGQQGARVGTSRSESHEVMRALDQGTFTVGAQRAFFVGALMQRVWEYAKVLDVNWNDDTISIAVSNRQKVAGVLFHVEAPVAEMFNLALARYRA